MLLMNCATIGYGTSETVQPPQPAPVSLLPSAPSSIAIEVISLMSSDEQL